jgi:predicted RNase H-like nuclease (RuvC/YqgF family)
MKSLKQLKDELSQLEKDGQVKMKPAEKKRLETQIRFVKMCIAYIESKPDPEYLNKEIERLKNRIEKIHSGFHSYHEPHSKYYKEAKKDYLKEMNISKVRSQIKTLSYLLN